MDEKKTSQSDEQPLTVSDQADPPAPQPEGDASQSAGAPVEESPAAKNLEHKPPARVEKTRSSAAAPVRGPGWWPLLVLLILLLLLAGAGIYLWQQALTQQQILRADVAAAVQRVDSQDSQTRDVQRSVDNLAAQLQTGQRAQEAAQERLRQQLASQNKRLLALTTTSRSDWLLAEAEYLMRLANQRLLMGKEVQGARELLQAADDIMRELDDSALFAVREALAGSIAALRAAGQLDTEGLYLELAAAAEQAAQLRLFEPPKLALQDVDPLVGDDWVQKVGSGLRSAWEKLGRYVQIRRRDQVYEPALAPEYEQAVRQNVRLMFEQAQLALLSNKPELYRRSLGKARDWLDSYYRLDLQQTRAVIAMIDELSARPIALPLPDISAPLRTLKDYLQTVHEASDAPALSEGGSP